MNQVASSFIIIGLTILTLILGKELIIPFIFAILIWLLMSKFRDSIQNIPFLGKRLSARVRSILSSIILLALVGALVKILQSNIATLVNEFPNYEGNIQVLMARFEQILPTNTTEFIKDIDVNKWIGITLSKILEALQSIISNAFIIVIYVIFILLEESSFDKKLHALFHKPIQYDQSKLMFKKIEHLVTDYIALKTLLALTSSILSGIALAIIGIDAPIFWALLIFLLNFIPIIGDIVGTLFPALFAIVQFGELTPGLLILISVGIIQGITSNVIEPKVMGNSLNISPLATILSLSLWGAIWGITGMFLSVPITVILILIFSQFPKTRPVAIILSTNGSINTKEK